MTWRRDPRFRRRVRFWYGPHCLRCIALGRAKRSWRQARATFQADHVAPGSVLGPAHRARRLNSLANGQSLCAECNGPRNKSNEHRIDYRSATLRARTVRAVTGGHRFGIDYKVVRGDRL